MWIRKLAWLLSAYLFLSCSGDPLDRANSTQRPNVILVTVDDLNTSLGSYGHPIVQSPNIDRLAERGVLFRRAYGQYPLCGPSRVSMLTGMRPDSTGIYENRTANFRDTHPDLLSLPQLFRENEYFVARVGKIFHQEVPDGIGKKGLDDPYAWDVALDPRGEDAEDAGPTETHATRFRAGFWPWYQEWEGSENLLTDGKVAREAIRLIEEHVEKRSPVPFFLAVGFFRPHPPFIAPKQFFELYSTSSIPLPRTAGSSRESAPKAALRTRPLNLGLTETEHRQLIRAYFASVSYVDEQIGLLLETLRQLKLLDNTVVVLLGDNGFLLGEHGQWLKMSLFEEAVRVPLLISAPSLRTRGRSCSRTVELLDLYPTLADLCGLPKPAHLEGISLVPLLMDPESDWSRSAFSQVLRRSRDDRFMGSSVRTERWRYTEWDDGRRGQELYDHDNDPFELENLSRDPAYSDVLEKLRRRLRGSS